MTQKYQVKVSMKQAAIVETGIVLKQGDFGMQIEIEVLDFDATGTTPQIVFRKAMGAVESTTITVSGNKYTYTFKGTELDTPGKCFCDLKLKNSTTQRISTASFMFRVVADTMDGLNEQASSYSDTIAQIVGGFDDEINELSSNVANLKNALTQLNIPFEWTDGYYLNQTGSVLEHKSFAVTNIIDIHTYTDITVIAGLLDAAAACIYDKSGNVIGYARNPGRNTPYTTSFSRTNYPDMYKVRFCTYLPNKEDCHLFGLSIDFPIVHDRNIYNASQFPSKYYDANNLPPNTWINMYFGWTEALTQNLIHYPITNFQGNILTVSDPPLNVWGFQLAIGEGGQAMGNVYFRYRYTSWSSWISMTGWPNINNMIDVKDSSSYSRLPAEYRDANNLPPNTVYAFKFGWTPEIAETMQNFPITPFSGDIMTINTVKDGSTFGAQIAFCEAYDSSNNKIYYRTRYKNWGSWNLLVTKEMLDDAVNVNKSYKKHLFAAFDKVAVIGDSLASGECYTGGVPTDFYQYSWLQFMCRESGITGYNFSRGGMTTKDWLTDSKGYPMASDNTKLCKAYFIGLGQNDANRSYTIGTINDINDEDYTQNADSYYGSYGGIIQRMKELVPDAKFFLITDPLGATSSMREDYNVAIRAINEHFTNCYLIDLSANYSDVFMDANGFIQQNNTSNHYSAAAYKFIANILGDIVDDIILNNPSEFKFIQYIGT